MTRLGLLLVAVAVTLTACSGAGGSPAADAPAAHAPKRFFGIVAGSTPDKRDFRKMKSTKVGGVRFPIFWPAVMPTATAPNWNATDKVVGNLAARGIQPLPFLYGSPGWVTHNRADPPIGSKGQRRKWKFFLDLAAGRYGPGGGYWKTAYKTQHPGARPLPIRTWQIWNEPNLKNFFHPKPSPRRYAKLVKISHSAIKKVDHHARIVLGGMPGFGDLYAWKFLDAFYGVHKIKRDFDAVSLHPYSRNLHQLKQELGNMRRVMGHHGDSKTPLWITEIGWGSAHPDGSLSKGSQGQKRALVKSFHYLLRARHKDHIQRVYWFDWRDPPKSAPRTNCKFCPTAGLLKHNHKPKPAYHAYRRFTR